MMQICLRLFLLLTAVTGILYPLFVTLIAQFAMPFLANGSMVEQRGSLLIAQNFNSESYFWPRPSAIDYDPLRPSGGSNLGPTSKRLKELVQKRLKQYGREAPSELLYASGSGLDPHISLAAAYYQAPRVANARGRNVNEINSLIDSLAESERYINVLLLNLHLDR